MFRQKESDMTQQANRCAVESLEQRTMFAVTLPGPQYAVGDVNGDPGQQITLQTKRAINAGTPTAGGTTQGIIAVLIGL